MHYSLSAQEATNNNLSFDNSLRTESEKLLTEWMDTFLTYQCDNLHPSLNGGVLCPACACMHGRIGDAVLPLMYHGDKNTQREIPSCCQTPDGLDGKRIFPMARG